LTDLAHLLGADGPLAEVVPGFSPRAEQLTMALAVADALQHGEALVVEAGTGTGKTFAYLVPALLSGRRVLVSTGTRNLQDQLYHRDLPVVSAALGRPVRVSLLKGRANYLCRQRLSVACSTPSLPGLEGDSRHKIIRIERWSQATRTGDIGELEAVAESDPVWSAVTSTRDNCLGQDCAEYSNCHVAAARREAQAADIVIVNHHLLLADMALREEGFGELLPGADAVILDEAHQFPDIAAQFFGWRVGSRPLASLARDTLFELTRAGLLDGAARAAIDGLERAVAAILRALQGLPERLEWHRAPDAVLEGVDELVSALDRLAGKFDDPDLEEAAIRSCGRRAAEVAGRLRAILTADEALGLRWLDASARGFVLEYVPFEVADRLRAQTEARPCAWIYTSATLAVGEDFTHFKERVGASDARCLHVASPFDYPSQALLYVPRSLPDPAEPGYTKAVVAAALPLIRAAGGRTFLLFTSHRGLTEALRHLKAMLEPSDAFPVLVQGEMPRDALLRRFRELGNAVLLGTGSFWEGVDVRGPALSLVVIDKLPFSSPDDPVLRARLEGLRRLGRNPFFEYQVPQAVLALKQGVGRLIRDQDDQGVVMVGDPRLYSKGYGRMFLSSLPAMRPTRDEQLAADFLREYVTNRCRVEEERFDEASGN
jgi:ATP-dependent DNA helicase DinG